MVGNIYINISFDDFHPEDWRWNIWDNVMNKLMWLKEKYPDIKYTFFTNPNFQHWYQENKILLIIKRRLHILWFKNQRIAFKKHKLSNQFNIIKHKERCNFVNKNIKNNTFEICIHWYDHYQKYLIPAAEFLDISSEENIKKIKMSEELLQKAWIKYTKAFRSPGWWNNKYLENDLKDLWYTYISFNPTQTTLDYKKDEKIFFIPQNYSIDDKNFNNSFLHLKENNFLFIKWHLYKKLENWIREDTVKNLENVINALKSRYIVNFIFINDIHNLYLDNKRQKIHEI